MTSGEVLALEGMSRAINAADPRWHGLARWTLEQFIAKGRPFTSEDILDLLDEMSVSTKDRRALGGIIRSARDNGEILMVGYVRSQRPSRHAAPVAQWVKA